MTASMNTPGPTTANSLLPANVNQLSYRSGGKTLIDAVSFTLNTPHITAVMGSNGAGKSLLLRLLHGLIEPSSGSVSWGNQPLNSTVRQQQAMVFQKPVLLRRSVAANIDFALQLFRQSARQSNNALASGSHRATIKSQRDDILDKAGLAHLAKQPARLLSGGEQQRLALARALVFEPDVLFLDEATASLDPASMARIETVVKAVHHSGTKIIMVTHDIGQAKRLADDVLFMHQGQLIEHTQAPAFFTQPTTERAQAYLEGRLLVD